MAVLVCLLLSLLAVVEAGLSAPPVHRLPDTSRPLEYKVALDLDPAREDYRGSVEIEVEILKPTRELWLNAEKLTFEEASLTTGGRTLEPRIAVQPSDFVGFEFAEELEPGKGTLRISFAGKFDSRGPNGIFRVQEGGEWYVFTQFEAIAARAGFPCYDEPSYKVPWTGSLRVPEGLDAVANTPQLSERPADGGMKTVVFAKSKPMPSYLVAFAVGSFDFVDAGKAGRNQTPLRIITPQGKAAHARYAVEVTGKVLEEMEAYFGAPYPYEKLDSIAIPLTFGFAAMENPGLVTYAERFLLSPPDRETVMFQREYVTVAAHEIAHQWFGNLVTPEYWDDIWLNEAFAMWLEAKITHRMRPQWKRDLEVANYKNFAMGNDSLITARSIRQPVERNGDIMTAFDGNTFAKGGAVIAMFEHWLGEAEFQNGVRRYLKRYEWGNATARMFLDSISTPQARAVSAAFSTFLNQPGIPLLTATLKCGSEPVVELRQERFLPLGSKGSAAQSWQFPICIAYEGTGSARPECHLLTAPVQEVPLRTSACPAWLNLNAGATGYYRVAYPDGMINRLAASGTLSDLEVADLSGNAFALANAGKLSVADALALTRHYAGHADWRLAGQSARIIQSFSWLVDPPLRPAYAGLVRELFGERARALGWEAQSDPEKELEQRELLSLVATLGEDAELRQSALVRAREWLKDRTVASTDAAATILEAAAQAGGAAFQDEIKAALPGTTNPREREVLVTALGKSGDPALVRRSLAMLTEKEIEFLEGGWLIFSPLRIDTTRAVSYEFVREHFDEVMRLAPAGAYFNFGMIVPFLAASLCDAEKAQAAGAFFADRLKDVESARRPIANMVEANELCEARKRALQPQLEALLAAGGL